MVGEREGGEGDGLSLCCMAHMDTTFDRVMSIKYNDVNAHDSPHVITRTDQANHATRAKRASRS